MVFHELYATYGKLNKAHLSLKPGMNVLYAPNESGKSTWVSFLLDMLYGMNTKERGPAANKNRYSPWSGNPLEGRIEISSGDQYYSITRSTQHSSSPMGVFSITYTGTSSIVEGITSSDCGESLLGVSRDVFERSALIAANQMSLSKSPELEKRITSLLSSGEETTSFLDANKLLKAQMNKRKYSSSGRIPQLEAQEKVLIGRIEEYDSLVQRIDTAQSRLDAYMQQKEYWINQYKLCELNEKRAQIDEYRQLTNELHALEQDYYSHLKSAGSLPSENTISEIESELSALITIDQKISSFKAASAVTVQKREDVLHELSKHPLYPASKESVEHRLSTFQIPKRSLWSIIIPIIILLFGVGLFFLPKNLIPDWIPYIPIALSFIVTITWQAHYIKYRKTVASQKENYLEQATSYQVLLSSYNDLSSSTQQTDTFIKDLVKQQQTSFYTLLNIVHPYCSDLTTLDDLQAYLKNVRLMSSVIHRKQQELQDLQFRCEVLSHSLGDCHLEPSCEFPSPDYTFDEVKLRLDEALQQLQAAQSDFDYLKGTLSVMEPSGQLRNQLTACQEELSEQRKDYQSLQLAMETLSKANDILQQRFSPELSKQTSIIFERITNGRYDKALLSRDFTMEAIESGEAIPRSIHSLSQGTADQLYLSARLAICSMVFPSSVHAPIILDDAFSSYDDLRMKESLNYLMELSRDHQVILFTCQEREINYLRNRSNVVVANL